MGRVMLDAGCGNGSQSVAYTALGLEVIAVDLSSGLEQLALMDIFGAPYAHYHSFEEVAGWYKAAGFTEVWPCNDGRRGFGVCGRFGAPAETQAFEASEYRLAQVDPQTQAALLMRGERA